MDYSQRGSHVDVHSGKDTARGGSEGHPIEALRDLPKELPGAGQTRGHGKTGKSPSTSQLVNELHLPKCDFRHSSRRNPAIPSVSPVPPVHRLHISPLRSRFSLLLRGYFRSLRRLYPRNDEADDEWRHETASRQLSEEATRRLHQCCIGIVQIGTGNWS